MVAEALVHAPPPCVRIHHLCVVQLRVVLVLLQWIPRERGPGLISTSTVCVSFLSMLRTFSSYWLYFFSSTQPCQLLDWQSFARSISTMTPCDAGIPGGCVPRRPP